jgi:hypothetical protein
MTKPKGSPSPSSGGHFNSATRHRFLGHLARTANVAASARAAGISSDAVYAARRRLPEFRAEWSEALAEGYVRLETALLAEALQRASSNTKDAMLKAKTQKLRLQLGLLNAHRGAAKGGAQPCAAPVKPADLATLKAQLILKLTQMRDRAGLPLNGTPKTGRGKNHG